MSILLPHRSWCRIYLKADIFCFLCNTKFLFSYETQGPVNEVFNTYVWLFSYGMEHNIYVCMSYFLLII